MEDHIVISKDMGSGDVDWIHLGKVRAQWWAVLYSVMNLGFRTHPCGRAHIAKSIGLSVRRHVERLEGGRRQMKTNGFLPRGVSCKVFRGEKTLREQTCEYWRER
jgi:hypothetical protein